MRHRLSQETTREINGFRLDLTSASSTSANRLAVRQRSLMLSVKTEVEFIDINYPQILPQQNQTSSLFALQLGAKCASIQEHPLPARPGGRRALRFGWRASP